MENRELEIRAAKILGCKETEDGTYWKIENVSQPILDLIGEKNDYHDVVLVSQLKFTSSYDWAFLGLTSPAKLIFEGVCEKVRARYSKANGFHMTSMPWDFMLASPEEMTQVWVEARENEAK